MLKEGKKSIGVVLMQALEDSFILRRGGGGYNMSTL